MLIDDLTGDKIQNLALAVNIAKTARDRGVSQFTQKEWNVVQLSLAQDWLITTLVPRVFGRYLPDRCREYIQKQSAAAKPLVVKVLTAIAPMKPDDVYAPIFRFFNSINAIPKNPELGVTQEDIRYAREKMHEFFPRKGW